MCIRDSSSEDTAAVIHAKSALTVEFKNKITVVITDGDSSYKKTMVTGTKYTLQHSNGDIKSVSLGTIYTNILIFTT